MLDNMKAFPPITFRKHAYSQYREGKARRAVKQFARRILGKDSLKKVNNFNIRLMTNWPAIKNPFREVPFKEVWDKKKGIVTLQVAPNWIQKDIGYGIKHELVHASDIIAENLISLKPRGAERLRVWWLEDDGYHYLYTKACPEDVGNHLYDKAGVSYKAFVEYTAYYYPWERRALLANRLYK